ILVDRVVGKTRERVRGCGDVHFGFVRVAQLEDARGDALKLRELQFGDLRLHREERFLASLGMTTKSKCVAKRAAPRFPAIAGLEVSGIVVISRKRRRS